MTRLGRPHSIVLASAVLLAGAISACGPARGGAPGESTATPAPAVISTSEATPVPTLATAMSSPSASLVAGSTMVGIGYDYSDQAGLHLAILAADGTQHSITVIGKLASSEMPYVEISPVDGGVVAAVRGRFVELRQDGSSRDLGPVPALQTSDLNSSFAISPDATQVAFETAIFSGASVNNRLYVARIGSTPRLIAERTATSHAGVVTEGPDAPEFWTYSVRRWTRQGILIVRGPEGVGGGGPFLSYDWYTAIVDPVTGKANPLTNGTATPLSSYSDTGQWVAVDWANSSNGGQYRDATPIQIEVGALDATVRSYRLEPSALAGDGVLDSSGERLAFATLDTATWQASDQTKGWQHLYHLHVLDLRTGESHVVGGSGLDPLAWTAGGLVVAEQVRTTDPIGTVTYVIVDSATGTVRSQTTIPSPWGSVVVTLPPSR